jgi:putative Holliday junction resolvase
MTAEQPTRVEAARKRVLALDYGLKRWGLAVSDELLLTAQPLATMVRTNRRNDLRRLRELCRKLGVARIVVGYPLNMDGSRGAMAEEAARFAARVQKELGLPVELADERLSSWEAARTLRQTKSRGKRPAKADDVAAAVILREYLDKQHALR